MIQHNKFNWNSGVNRNNFKLIKDIDTFYLKKNHNDNLSQTSIIEIYSSVSYTLWNNKTIIDELFNETHISTILKNLSFKKLFSKTFINKFQQLLMTEHTYQNDHKVSLKNPEEYPKILKIISLTNDDNDTLFKSFNDANKSRLYEEITELEKSPILLKLLEQNLNIVWNKQSKITLNHFKDPHFIIQLCEKIEQEKIQVNYLPTFIRHYFIAHSIFDNYTNQMQYIINKKFLEDTVPLKQQHKKIIKI